MKINKQKVAAVQMRLEIGQPVSNIDKCLSQLEVAFRQGRQFVALPEFVSTPICLVDGVEDGILQPQNAFVDGLVDLCKQYGACAGGSYLEARDGQVFNTYAFVDQQAHVFKHDKDIPTMVESAFYTGGTSDRLLETGSGRIGVAMCWEMIRTRTVKRLAHQADLIMAGSHWWSEPGWPIPFGLLQKAHERNLALMRSAPSGLSRMTGAPVIHAAHIGVLTGRFAVTPRLSVPMTTNLLGQTQIVNNRGAVVAALSAEDGEGIIYADIEIGNIGYAAKPHGEFWNTPIPWETRLVWAHQNRVCSSIYEGRGGE